MIVGLDHVQLAMPPGQEEQARAFYGGCLGLVEVEKPEPLASRGGCWFGRCHDCTSMTRSAIALS